MESMYDKIKEFQRTGYYDVICVETKELNMGKE